MRNGASTVLYNPKYNKKKLECGRGVDNYLFFYFIFRFEPVFFCLCGSRMWNNKLALRTQISEVFFILFKIIQVHTSSLPHFIHQFEPPKIRKFRISAFFKKWKV